MTSLSVWQMYCTLAELNTMMTDDISTGLLPNDNPVPEPACLALLMPVLAMTKRRRKRA